MAKLTLRDYPSPLWEDENGEIRVGQTRVWIDTVVIAYTEFGWTADQIVRQYPTLDLAEVHATLAYYVRHRAEVDEYIRQEEEENRAAEAKMRAANPDLFITVDELRARKAANVGAPGV